MQQNSAIGRAAETLPCVELLDDIGRRGCDCAVVNWPVGPQELCLRANEVHVWAMPLDLSGEQVLHCWDMLASDERQRAERFRFATDQHRFIVARSSLRMLLGRYLMIPGSAVCFQYGQFGKPEIAECHDCDIRFNLAHCGELAICAFARSVKVGVDVESAPLRASLPELPSDLFASGEQAGLAAIPLGLRNLASLMLWTRKEAYLKAVGCGLQPDLSSFEISVPPAEPRLLSPTVADSGATCWFFQDLRPASNAIGTLCLEGNATIRLWSRMASVSC